MDTLFTTLSAGLEQEPLIALLAALGWGLASVALSPCHLMTVPLAVAFVRGGPQVEQSEARSTLGLSVVFALATLVCLALIGGVTLASGRIAGDIWGIAPWLAAALLLFAGLLMLGVIDLPGLRLDQDKVPRGYRGAAIVGGTVGLTLGPCTFAFMAPVIGVAIATSLGAAVTLFLAFSLGHTIGVVVAGVLGARVGVWISRGGRAAGVVKSTLGVLLIGTAITMIATAP